MQGPVYPEESTRVWTKGNMGFKRTVYYFLRLLAFHLGQHVYSSFQKGEEEDKKDGEGKGRKIKDQECITTLICFTHFQVTVGRIICNLT